MMDNVYIFPRRGGNRPPPTTDAARAFDALTDAIILSRAAAGTLDPGIVAALLAAVRQPGSARADRHERHAAR